MKKQDLAFNTYRNEQIKRETEANNARVALRNQIKELEQDVDFRKS